LGGGDEGLEDELGGNPAVGTGPFRDELGGEFGCEEGDCEDCCAEVVVYMVSMNSVRLRCGKVKIS
jgi:hypothetical protein